MEITSASTILFINHGNYFCINTFLSTMEITPASIPFYQPWKLLLHQYLFINQGNYFCINQYHFYQYLFINQGNYFCINTFLSIMEITSISIPFYQSWKLILHQYLFINHGSYFCINTFLSIREINSASIPFYRSGN